ncbi:MAG: hypothetical protein QOC57_163 [Ilumatobacteraceae bacterium]
MTADIKVPNADHPITIDTDTVRATARVGDTLIAETNAALTLREAGYPPVHYIPLGDVVPGTLRPSASHSYCPYKGDASYYDIVLPDGTELTAAVWTYLSPYPAVDAIAGRVAFYADRVQVDAATSNAGVPGTGPQHR